MPYVVRKRGEKWACENPDTGKLYGEHESEEAALAQARALYVNAPPDEEEKKTDAAPLREADHPEDEDGNEETEEEDEPESECVLGEDGSCLTHKDGKCKRQDAGTSEGARKGWESRRGAGGLQWRKDSARHTVRRFDVLERLDGPTLLPNGWLRADAHIARIGIQEYRRGDGSVRRELRLPDDVFHSDALTSFSMLPVTDDHPPEGLLDAENTRKYQRGHLGETVTQDGQRVKAPVLITDAALVKKVLAGKTQLSCGYVCDLDETPGEWEGQRFDAVQRAIRGNHVAVVQRARGGPELRLKLDTQDAVSIRADQQGGDDPLAATSTAQERTMTVKMQLDGIEVEVANEQGAQLIGRGLQTRDQRIDSLEKALKAAREDADKAAASANANAEALRARATVAETKVTELEKGRKDAEDALPNLVRERVALLEQARAVLGPEAKFDNLDALGIKRTVVSKIQPDIKLDGESPDFVNGIYQASILAHARRVAQVGVSEARRLNGPARIDGEVIDAEAAREKARRDSEEEWKKPLSAAK